MWTSKEKSLFIATLFVFGVGLLLKFYSKSHTSIYPKTDSFLDEFTNSQKKELIPSPEKPAALLPLPDKKTLRDSLKNVNRKDNSSPLKTAEVQKKLCLSHYKISDFMKLPGVGPKTAEKLLSYQKQKGGFRQWEELLSIKGIGPVKLAKIKNHPEICL